MTTVKYWRFLAANPYTGLPAINMYAVIKIIFYIDHMKIADVSASSS
jgi:hypothetical protein